MKPKFSLYYTACTVWVIALFAASCYPFNLSLKPDGSGPAAASPVPNPVPVSINLGDAYTGDYTVDTDGTIIKSITTDAGEILIGRSVTDSIELNIQSDGSPALRDPVSGSIPIGSYAEFQLINTVPGALADSYLQEADLDLMSVEWTPVGNEPDYFTGTFDGDGKHIDNILINNPAPWYSGLFGVVKTGIVENVHVRSGNVEGNNKVGGIVGTLCDGAVVRHCSNAASITGLAQVGGIVGRTDPYSDTVWVIACFNTGAVSGTYGADGVGGVGGVVGVVNYDKVIACYNTGPVSGVGDTHPGDGNLKGVGGVVGCLWGGGSYGELSACYNTGSVTSSSDSDNDLLFGGVVGFTTAGLSPIHANYWHDDSADTAVWGIGTDPGHTGALPATNTDAAPFSSTGWPTTGTHTQWGIGNGSGDGTYWKSLGSWNGGNPKYPKLWYEDDE